MLNFLGIQSLCAVSGNDSIALLTVLFSKNIQNKQIFSTIEGIIFSNKMCVSSYRQTTRFNLYTIILKILEGKQKENFTNEFILRVVSMLED